MKKKYEPKTAVGKKMYQIIQYLESFADPRDDLSQKKTTIENIANHLKITHPIAIKHLKFLMEKGYVWRCGRFLFGLKMNFPVDFDYRIFDVGSGKTKK
jgi:DNA-binding MarR family transcriptional regulator